MLRVSSSTVIAAKLSWQFLSRAILAILISILVIGCDKKADEKNTKEQAVLAIVDGDAITAADVSFMVERMLQGQGAVQVDEAFQKKILDSLIASRAMKQQVKSHLSEDEIGKITQAAKTYEEELYVKAYLQQFVIPEPVTPEMVQQYYDKHADEFGGEIIRDFEMLRLPAAIGETQRQQLLAAITEISAMPSWELKHKEWQENYGLQYQQGRSQSGLLHLALDQAISRLGKGETSDVIYIDDELYVVRVTHLSNAALKPLPEVSADIRNRLAARVLRDAVQKASDTAKEKAKIEIPTKN